MPHVTVFTTQVQRVTCTSWDAPEKALAPARSARSRAAGLVAASSSGSERGRGDPVAEAIQKGQALLSREGEGREGNVPCRSAPGLPARSAASSSCFLPDSPSPGLLLLKPHHFCDLRLLLGLPLFGQLLLDLWR